MPVASAVGVSPGSSVGPGVSPGDTVAVTVGVIPGSSVAVAVGLEPGEMITIATAPVVVAAVVIPVALSVTEKLSVSILRASSLHVTPETTLDD
jgi:hypothetical protein